jgi:hypothetical protein
VCPVGAIAGAANRFNLGFKFPRQLSNWGLPLLAFIGLLWGFREFGINVLREPLITAVWISGVIAVAILVSILFQRSRILQIHVSNNNAISGNVKSCTSRS